MNSLRAIVLLCPLVLSAGMINVTDPPFNAVGDGTTDNYIALGQVAAYACQNPGTVILFPPGSYFIAHYKIIAGANANGITDITWNGCSNVTIFGYGAEIVSNGAFNRHADSGVTSWENTVSPFRIVGANGFRILGISLNGQVDHMTKDPGVVEGQDYGVSTTSSTGVLLRDVHTHHWATDGVILGLLQGVSTADKNDRLENLATDHNARMGLTISNLNGLVADNLQCSSIGIGFTGSYGGHPPEDCVDIEPPVGGNVPTGNLVFRGGRLSGTVGALFTVIASGATDLLVDGMVFDCGVGSGCETGTGSIVSLSAKRTLVTGCQFYAQNGRPVGSGQPYATPVERLEYSGNTFHLTGLSQFNFNSNDGTVRPVYFHGNLIYVDGSQPATNGALNLDHTEDVAGNTFFVSKLARFGSVSSVVNFTGASSIQDNVYSTDLTTGTFSANYVNVRYTRNERSLSGNFIAVP